MVPHGVRELHVRVRVGSQHIPLPPRGGQCRVAQRLRVDPVTARPRQDHDGAGLHGRRRQRRALLHHAQPARSTTPGKVGLFEALGVVGEQPRGAGIRQLVGKVLPVAGHPPMGNAVSGQVGKDGRLHRHVHHHHVGVH